MKIITILFILSFLSITSFPQAYHPVIEPNKVWDQSDEDGYFPCSFLPRRYKFTDNDTVLGGVTYRICNEFRLLGVPGPGIMTCPPFMADTLADALIFMREDTTERKVFIYDEESYPQVDQLLYDFTLNIGDTLQSYFASTSYPLILDTIFDVILDNGDSRREYLFSSDWLGSNIGYIEGVGGINGIATPLYRFESPGNSLYCLKKDDDIVLGNMYCDFYFVGVKDQKDISVSVYPNPSEDFVNVELENVTGKVMFEILDIKGTILFSRELKALKSGFSLDEVGKGLFIYRITTKESTIRGKLIRI
jgi:hypothetical protein